MFVVSRGSHETRDSHTGLRCMSEEIKYLLAEEAVVEEDTAEDEEEEEEADAEEEETEEEVA